MAPGSDFGVVFCGGGPAALGPFVAAARLGRFDELLAQRVLIVERGSRIGAGSLRHYRISSNSFGGAFVEGLDGSPAGGPFEPARHTPAADELRRVHRNTVPLRTAGAYLDTVGDALHTAIEDHRACAVACCTSVRQIALNRDGTLALTLVRDDVDRVIQVERAVISMGGRTADHPEQVEILPGLTLARWAGKVQPASTVLDDRKFLPAGLLESLGRSGRVTIIGGSHSAWSTALVLLRDLRLWTGDARTPQITLLHRSHTRLFYLTAAEAQDDGFVFDPVLDVCPLTGRVNRASGLKGEARDLARRVLRSNADRELPIDLVNLCDNVAPRTVAEILDESAVIFVATGYHATLPDLIDETGDPIRPAFLAGGLAVTESAAVLAAGGRVFPQLQAYGLGVHTPVSRRIGGEPSYPRAITSAWLYQHDLGETVLRSLVEAESTDRRPEIPILARAGLGW